MDEKTYNGWKNYETWCVALWLDNERNTYEFWRALAREYVRNAPENYPRMFPESTPHRTAIAVLANRIRAELLDGTPYTGGGVYADLLGAALSEVDWQEIAGHYVADGTDECESVGKEKAS